MALARWPVAITDHEVRLCREDAARSRLSADLLVSSAAAVFDDNLITVMLTGAAGQHHGWRGEQFRVLRACYGLPLPHEQRVVVQAHGDDLHDLRALLCAAGRRDHA